MSIPRGLILLWRKGLLARLPKITFCPMNGEPASMGALAEEQVFAETARRAYRWMHREEPA